MNLKYKSSVSFLLIFTFLVTAKAQDRILPDLGFSFPKFQIDTSAYESVPSLSQERQNAINFQWAGPIPILTGFGNMYNGKIIEDPADKQFPYKIWFFGWSFTDCNRHVTNIGCDAIFFGKSKNLFDWQIFAGKDLIGRSLFVSKDQVKRWMPVFTARDKFFDQWHNGDPSVQKIGDLYYMVYSITGSDIDGIQEGHSGDKDKDISAIGGAVSKNGVDWIRSERPIMISRNDIGTDDPQSDGLYHRPSLLIESGKVRMWFDYWTDVGGLSMGMAELDFTGSLTPDKFLNNQWVIKQGKDHPAIKNFPNPSVVKLGDKYYAYADPVGYSMGWMGRQTVEAVSQDGLNWKINGYLNPQLTNIDCADYQVPEATVIKNQVVIVTACHPKGTDDFRYRAMQVWKRNP